MNGMIMVMHGLLVSVFVVLHNSPASGYGAGPQAATGLKEPDSGE